MHAIKLNVGESAYAHVMFLLKNLNTSEVQVVEDISLIKIIPCKSSICQHIRLRRFKSIQDPTCSGNTRFVLSGTRQNDSLFTGY